MHRFTISILAVLALACDPAPDPSPELREAPDVPWLSVEIAGEVKTPLGVGDVLVDCFTYEFGINFNGPPAVHYIDKEPDGDDWQPAQLCVEWTAHLDLGDCVRRGLLKLGGEVVE